MKTIYILLAAIALAGCGASEKENTVSSTENTGQAIVFTSTQMKNAGIETGKPETRELHRLLKVNGLVDVPPQNLVNISFPLGGYLKSTTLLPGMKVSKGEVIAVMEDQACITLQQDYLVSAAKTDQLKKEFERQKNLNQTKSTSDKSFELAEADYKSELVTMNALREKLLLIGISPDKLTENTISRSVNIHSPIDGYVSSVNVNIGKYVNPTDVLFELVNPTDLHLALTVFEKDLPLIHPGQKVRAHSPQHPDRVIEAEIILVGKKLDDNRSAEIHCHFAGNTDDLLPGMFVNAEIELQTTGDCVVPEASIVRFGDGEYVFVQSAPEQFVMTKVQTGVTDSGYTEIMDPKGILRDKTIITKNAWSALMKKENKSEE